MPAWVQQASDDYIRRFPSHWQFALREIPQANLGAVSVNKSKEAEALLAAVPEKAHVIAMDERGKPWSTQELAQQMLNWQTWGKPVALVVGGPDGLAAELLAKADQRFSLSALTFPHPLVRVILTEQLYRAHSLNTNHPYHRA